METKLSRCRRNTGGKSSRVHTTSLGMRNCESIYVLNTEQSNGQTSNLPLAYTDENTITGDANKNASLPT